MKGLSGNWRVWMAGSVVFLGIGVGISMAQTTPTGREATGGRTMTEKTRVVREPGSVEPGGAVAVKQGLTLREMIRNGGWLMYVLAALSVLMLSLVLYLGITLRRTQILPPQLYRELLERLKDFNITEARRLCEDRPCALSSLAMAALEYTHRCGGSVDGAFLRDVLQSEGERQAESLQGQTQYLLDIAVVAPMVGLLGTVVGMMKAFGAVAYDIASVKPVILAAGVSQATITTAFGLMVAIPATIFYSYFRRQAAKQVCALEIAGTEILRLLSPQST